MEPHRDRVRHLADDLEWLERHCRAQPALAPQAGRLRLAAALARNVVGPALEGATGGPLHIAVVGGAGAGKSTVVNFLCGAVVADANPQAGFTRHPTAFVPAEITAAWPSHLGFLGPLRRLTDAAPADLDDDVYQVRPLPPKAASPLDDYVVWDCPDMTTWASEGYVSRLLEVAALADVIVYVASDERYNDEVPTQFLQLLLAAGKAVVVTLTKMREADAAALTEHFRTEVLAKLDGAVAVPIVAIPNLPPAARSEPLGAAAVYRVALVNPVLALCPSPTAAKRRTAVNAVTYLETAANGLIEVARVDLAELSAWKGAVAGGRQTFEARYRSEYLAGEPFQRFERTKEQVLGLLDLPGPGRYVSATLALLRKPYAMAREFIVKLAGRPQSPAQPEGVVLLSAMAAWLDSLQAVALRRAAAHPLWAQVAHAFDAGLKSEAMGRFQAAAREYELDEGKELEQAGRSLPDQLTANPTLLTGLRLGIAALDIAAALAVVYFTWLPSWYHLLLVPLAVSLTHQIVEWIVAGTVEATRRNARAQREALLAARITGPLATWFDEIPSLGGSAVERLQVLLRRVPEIVRELSAALIH